MKARQLTANERLQNLVTHSHVERLLLDWEGNTRRLLGAKA